MTPATWYLSLSFGDLFAVNTLAAAALGLLTSAAMRWWTARAVRLACIAGDASRARTLRGIRGGR